MYLSLFLLMIMRAPIITGIVVGFKYYKEREIDLPEASQFLFSGPYTLKVFQIL